MKRVIIFNLVILLTLISASGAIFSFNKVANAQLAVPTSELEFSPLNFNAAAISANTLTTNGLIGLPGSSKLAIEAARKRVGDTCNKLLIAIDQSDKVDTFIDTTSSSFLSIIGGGIGESSQLAGKIVKATTAKECIDGYILILSNIPTVALTMGQDLQREQDKFTKSSESLRKIIEDLKARQSASVKDVLKAFMVKLVLNLNKNLTTKLVNSMVQKYKIDDYLAYGDALATQVYSMKYINDNYKGDARTQMMLRSLIQSEKFPDKAQTALTFANTKAQDYLASQCGSTPVLDVNDSNSLRCLAAYGDERSSTSFQFQSAVDLAQKAKASGVQSAQGEISQSNGFAPPRNCDGSIAAQQQIDAQYDQGAKELAASAVVVAKLEKALADGQTTQAEVDKAKASYAELEQKYKNLPSQESSPIIDICKAIDSPAAFVGDQLNNFVKQHLEQGSQLQSDNLPFYATFLSDLASNFLSNLLTGGKSGSQILKEGGLSALNGAVGELVSQLPKPPSGVNIPEPSKDNTPITYQASNGPLITYRVGLTETRQPYYIIDINVDGNFRDAQTGKTTAVSYKLEGPNIGGDGVNLVTETGYLAKGYNVFAPSGSTYKLTVYGANNVVLRNAQFTVNENNDGRVQGATTVEFGPRKSSFSPRG